ncbi:unnamed protein product [Arctia plantaginis]|uniref:Uncharacterized protein n=1 Tax=Arctia plantaginis TaxID=874455 RepID=A0A8S1AWV6_ARCPL|nr:unnamed protein product [Arctia plantaginis]
MCLCIRNEQQNYDENYGIFAGFLSKYLDMLGTGCSGLRLKRHCRLMYEELKKMDYKYTKKLGKLYKGLSKLYSEEINGYASLYRQELDKKPYHRATFIKTMNEIFTLQEHIRFEDYLHELYFYCNGYKLLMNTITKKLLSEVIMNSIKTRLSRRDQKKLEKTLEMAIREYRDLKVQDLVLKYNLSTLKPFIPVRMNPSQWALSFELDLLND